jgi:class 3 adenylate cyclase/tetratricopeptide (TPR) repeat protein
MSPSQGRSPSEPGRRTVTVVFSDLKGSTALGERLDAESLRTVLTRYFDEVRTVFEVYGGRIEKIIGDAVVAVFGLSAPDGEDALRAVAAVAEAEQTLASLNEYLDRSWGVRLVNRTGVATGELVVGEDVAGRHVLSGRVMELAEALEAAAPGLGALLDEETLRRAGSAVTVEPAGAVTPKGRAEAVPAFRLVAVDDSARHAAGDEDVWSCPECAADNAMPSRRCWNCASPLMLAGGVAETRRTVTVVFADPKPQWQTPPPAEVIEAVMSRYFDVMRHALEAHGATVEKFIGDAVMAVFGLPVRHEDDALRAVRAAADMQAALSALNEELGSRWGVRLRNPIGVNTGEVVAGDATLGQRLVTGDAVNVAARLEQAAQDGEVLLGDLTHRLVCHVVDAHPVEPLTLKGKAEPVPAFRLVEMLSRVAPTTTVKAPLVGRDAELATLGAALQEAREQRVCRMVTVVGDAGVGKTRLTQDFLGSVGMPVVAGRCLPYGDGITFWPIVEVVRVAAGIQEGDAQDRARARIADLAGDAEVAERVASVVGLSDASFQVDELFWGIRRLVEIVAADAGLVVHFDDVHWAEDTFLDLVEHLVATVAAPVLLVCTARPELLEEHEAWATAQGADRVVLRPLSPEDAARVMEHLLGTDAVDPAVSSRVVEAAAGNPLFVEQLMSMLVDERLLRQVDGRWKAVGDMSRLAIPPSLDALLASRLDRLPPDERDVVDPASVIGQRFSTPAVRALVSEPLRPEVPAHLQALTRRQFVQPVDDDDDEDDAYRFQHLLVKDAAYAGLLKQRRAVLHERFVAWADVINRERGREAEFEEILGYHLEQAHRYRAELGPLDEHGLELGVRASERLASAGGRAVGRGDVPAAAGLLLRAAAPLPPEHPRRPRLLLQAGESQMEMGAFAEAAETLEEALEQARLVDDVASAAWAEIERLRLGYQTGTISDTERVVSEAHRLRADLEGIGDPEGLARAWRLLANVELFAERWGAAEEAARQMIRYARDSGNTVMELRVLPALAGIARYGPTPVDEAIALCEELLTRTARDRRAEVFTVLPLARLRAMKGDFDEARRLYRRARSTLDELGWAFEAALVSLDSGPIELLAGDAEAAEAELRGDFQALQALGETNFIATTAALLAEALYRQGRYDEAAEMARFTETTAEEDDVASQFLWRSVMAKILARKGRHDEAADHAAAATELIEGSDDPNARAEVLLDAAEVHRLAGRDDEAARLSAEALALFEAKGNVVSAAHTRELLSVPGRSAAGS